jgi:hypothetical protein
VVDYPLCSYDGVPCFRERKCFVKVHDAHFPYYVCVRVRFKGADSVRDVGMGMTIYEKLERAGLIPK